jgi:copper chaperone CopZ
MFRIFSVVILAVSTVGCGEGNLSSPGVTPTTFNTAGAPTVEFNAPDMMCAEGCGAKVNEILSKQRGAKEVVVDFESRKATVAIDPDANFDANAALAALVDHGFKNSSIKSAATSSEPATPPSTNDSTVQ